MKIPTPEIKPEKSLMKILCSFLYLFWFSCFLGGCQAKRGSKLNVLKMSPLCKDWCCFAKSWGKANIEADENLDIYLGNDYLKHM